MRLIPRKIEILYVCLILMLFWGNAMQAQVSGYQGKRHYIKAEFASGYFAGYIDREIVYNKGSDSRLLGVRYLNYNFVSGRRTELMLGYQNFKGTFDLFYGGVIYDNGVKASYKGNMLCFGYRKYYSGLAPLGSYLQVDLSRLNLLGEDIDEEDYYNLDEDPVIFKNSFWHLAIAFGDQRIIGNRLVLDMAVHIGIPPRWTARLPLLKYGISYQRPDNTFYDRVHVHQVLKFKIGLGVLLF